MTDVSVIVPTYNHAQFLDDCLDSIYQQEGVSMEIIVVDDGSSDNTAEIMERHRGNVRYIYKENAGLSAARNTGLSASRGRYIQFLDADDLLAPYCLYHKLQEFSRHDSKTILVCRNRLFSKVKANGALVRKGYWKLYTSNLNTHLCRVNIAPPHAYFIQRSLIDDIDGFNESYRGCEDYDFWLRALGAGYNFHYCAEALVFYRRNNNSMARTKARAGIYPFDVIVHQKKHSGNYGAGVEKILETVAGRLALADGAITTALLINPEANPTGLQQLLDIACAQIEGALERLSVTSKHRTLEERLYFKRIVMRKSIIRRKLNEPLPELVMELESRCNSVRKSLSDMRMMFPITRYERQALMLASLKAAFGEVLE